MPDAAHVNFLSSDHAYEYLLESWVTPGDPACSPLMHMFENGRMPPTITGKPGLDAQDICAIAKWIEAGAHQ